MAPGRRSTHSCGPQLARRDEQRSVQCRHPAIRVAGKSYNLLCRHLGSTSRKDRKARQGLAPRGPFRLAVRHGSCTTFPSKPLGPLPAARFAYPTAHPPDPSAKGRRPMKSLALLFFRSWSALASRTEGDQNRGRLRRPREAPSGRVPCSPPLAASCFAAAGAKDDVSATDWRRCDRRGGGADHRAQRILTWPLRAMGPLPTQPSHSGCCPEAGRTASLRAPGLDS
jgi:hypothetical protein